MKGAIKAFLAVIAAILYGGAAILVLTEAQNTPGSEPNTFLTLLLNGGAGAIIAFITAQLGLAIAKQGDGAFRNSVNSTMGSDGSQRGVWLLLLDVIIFSIVGLWFVLLAVKPELIAVAEGTDSLKDAPEYIDAHATLFVGVVFAAVAGIAPSASD